MAWPTPQVVRDVTLKHIQCGANESGHAVGMSAGTPALDEAAHHRNGGDAVPKSARLDGEQLHGIGQDVKSVDTGSALSGPFAFEVSDHPADLDQGTDVGGEEHYDAGPNRRAKLAGRLLGQRHGQGLGRGNPTSAVAAKEHPSY
jgi:hypothetical protein